MLTFIEHRYVPCALELFLFSMMLISSTVLYPSFILFPVFNNMKKTKKIEKIKNNGGKVSISYVGNSLLSFEQRTIFESVSQYFGFSMDLGEFVALLNIIATGWLFFHPYGEFDNASCVRNVSHFIIHVSLVTSCVMILFKGSLGLRRPFYKKYLTFQFDLPMSVKYISSSQVYVYLTHDDIEGPHWLLVGKSTLINSDTLL
jgi:hypothetical protein